MKNYPNSLKISLLAVSATLLFTGLYWVNSASDSQSTDDAYVAADYTVVSSKLSGFIAKVLVDDNQTVHAGQLLARIDDRDYQAALSAAEAGVMAAKGGLEQASANLDRQQAVIEQAKAMVNVSQADMILAKHDLSRYNALASEGAGSVQNAQQARSKIDTARAHLDFNLAALTAARRQVRVLQAQRDRAEGELKHAQAELEKAQLNITYTQITAPIDGVIGRRTLRVGNLVNPGTPLLAVVPISRSYVVANFRETQLSEVQPRQRAVIKVDALPGTVFHGYVDSIAPTTGVEFAPIRPINATGNFTRIVQRIPVKIELDAGQAMRARLRPGMSAIASIDTEINTSDNSTIEQAPK